MSNVKKSKVVSALYFLTLDIQTFDFWTFDYLADKTSGLRQNTTHKDEADQYRIKQRMVQNKALATP